MPINRIALYHLETLLWIARLGTFGAAATRLNTTQPTISARVRELEAQVGYALFRREGRGMALTVRGRQLVQDCEPLCAALRLALATDGLTGATGVVRIGTGEIVAASCLPGFVAEVEAALPGVTLEITISLTAQMLQDLLGATSDIVFLAGPVSSPGIRTTPIGDVGLRWLASPKTVQAARAGAVTPIWSLSQHSPLHQVMIEALMDAPPSLARHPIHTCNNAQLLINIITTGNAMALLPETMAREAVAAGHLVEIREAPQRRVLFQAAIRSAESDPVVLDLFARASRLNIDLASLTPNSRMR